MLKKRTETIQSLQKLLLINCVQNKKHVLAEICGVLVHHKGLPLLSYPDVLLNKTFFTRRSFSKLCPRTTNTFGSAQITHSHQSIKLKVVILV